MTSVQLTKQWWENSPENVRIALLSESYMDRLTTESAITSIGLPSTCLTVVCSFQEVIKKATQNGNFKLILIDIDQCNKDNPPEKLSKRLSESLRARAVQTVPKTVLLTNQLTSKPRTQDQLKGVDFEVSKPVQGKDLRQMLNSFLV